MTEVSAIARAHPRSDRAHGASGARACPASGNPAAPASAGALVTRHLSVRPKVQGGGAPPRKDDLMRADTKTIAIHAKPEKVLDFLADPMNLPRWAIGFARGVRRDGDRWVVTTCGGEMGIRIAADQSSGVVDFYMSPAPGVESLAASRVVPGGAGVEYVFTQFQAPDMPDEVFAKNVQALAHELSVLKALLEVECPL